MITVVEALRSRGVKVLLIGREPKLRASRAVFAEPEVAALVEQIRGADRGALVQLLRAEETVTIALETPQERWKRVHGARLSLGQEFSPAARSVLRQRGRMAAGLDGGGELVRQLIDRDDDW